MDTDETDNQRKNYPCSSVFISVPYPTGTPYGVREAACASTLIIIPATPPQSQKNRPQIHTDGHR
ncbi:hypothetical protein [Fischerella sp. NIES-3754]|nr:hypothetical protein [Fischerella sp. NIES-3754]BAU05376.1 hypothetical protein FIS3754_12710 [Fischerella sp. NIES-3754]BCX07637.1 MAG: hypothetical protein KatS3mg066_1496 [Fischerella sp.]